MSDANVVVIRNAMVRVEAMAEESARRRQGAVSVEMQEKLKTFEELTSKKVEKLTRDICLIGFETDTSQAAQKMEAEITKAWEELR